MNRLPHQLFVLVIHSWCFTSALQHTVNFLRTRTTKTLSGIKERSQCILVISVNSAAAPERDNKAHSILSDDNQPPDMPGFECIYGGYSVLMAVRVDGLINNPVVVLLKTDYA